MDLTAKDTGLVVVDASLTQMRAMLDVMLRRFARTGLYDPRTETERRILAEYRKLPSHQRRMLAKKATSR